MKVINKLILIPTLILLFLLLIIIQINLGIKTTILSEHFFSGYVDEVQLGKQATNYLFAEINAVDVIDVLGEGTGVSITAEQESNGDEMLQDYKDLLNKNVDQEWLQAQINVLVKGIHGYMVNDLEKLPAIDITPVKDIVTNTYSSQIIANSNSEEAINQIREIVEKINENLAIAEKQGYSRDKLVSEVMKLEEIKTIGLSSEFTEKLIDRVLLIENGDEEEFIELYEFLVNQLVKEKLNIESIKDQLDLDEVITNVYGNSNNPMSSIRSIIGWYKTNLFIVNSMIILLLIAISLSLTSKITNGGYLVAGLLIIAGIAISALVFIFKERFIDFILVIDNQSLEYFKENILVFANNIIFRFIIDGIVLASLGILIIATVSLFNKWKKLKANVNTDKPSGVSKRSLAIIRLLVVLLSSTLIFISIKYSTTDLINRVDILRASIEESNASINKEDNLNIIIEATGAEFLQSFSGKEAEEAIKIID